MDREPRQLTETELELLEQLGDLVEYELRLVHTVHLQDQLLASQEELALEKHRTAELLRTVLSGTRRRRAPAARAGRSRGRRTG
jgi:hypothetical protein